MKYGLAAKQASLFALLLGVGAAMSTVSAFDENRAPNWVQVTNRTGWQPRDSQGEVVYRGRMWILGGWFNSYRPAFRDVWSTSNGKQWTLVTTNAAWRSSHHPMTVVFKNRMWFMGGWFNGRLPGHTATKEVWWSTNGKKWERANDAGWSPRMGAGAVAFKDRMWMLGGIEDCLSTQTEQCLKNDIWCSSNGQEWKLVTNNAPWSPRALHQAVVFKNKIWVLGGGNYQPTLETRNDVWCSEDGTHWTQVLEHAPWPGRIWFSAVVYRDRIWVLGGESGGRQRLGDVWYSADGKNWSELKSDVTWSARHEHSTFVFQDKIWVAGGYDPKSLDSEVWSLDIPKKWFNNP